MFASFKRLDFWSLLEHPPPGVDIHIVRAANSDRFSRRELDALAGIQRGNASGDGRVHVHVLPDAGHWLHVENPEGLLEMISHPLAAAAGPAAA
jgi:pimeloyl-ACP methyl ester carboxylesterase